jgi:SAM-dependent methyltransferase
MQTAFHDNFNPDLLKLIPRDCARVVEVGCMSGAMAQAYRELNPACRYVGVEIESRYCEVAKTRCTEVVCGNIEALTDDDFSKLFPSDCWVFGDVLEHLYDPWSMLKKVRARLNPASCIVACIPNVQHWSIQANLNAGNFRYESHGLMDRTHIRWFTKKTIFHLFESTGFRIVEGHARVFDAPPPGVAEALQTLAAAAGLSSAQSAAEDAKALQYVVKAVPV